MLFAKVTAKKMLSFTVFFRLTEYMLIVLVKLQIIHKNCGLWLCTCSVTTVGSPFPSVCVCDLLP